MRAFRKELIDGRGNFTATIIGVIVPPYDNEEIRFARGRLFEYINERIGYDKHDIFMNIDRNIVSAVITRKLNLSEDEEFEL